MDGKLAASDQASDTVFSFMLWSESQCLHYGNDAGSCEDLANETD